MTYEGFFELARKRRSIRKFKSDPVPNEHIDRIIEVARLAPSGGNSQPWEFIVVRKKELKNRIAELVKEQYAITHKMELTRVPELRFPKYAKPITETPGFGDAPVYIMLCGDVRTKETYPKDAVLVQGDLIFTSSLAGAFIYMNLAATSLGLGVQWVSAVASPYVQTFIKILLHIPKELEIYHMMAVGYPDMVPPPKLVRAMDEQVHYDYYDQARLRTDRQVEEFIAACRT
jgi:nitroreductase